MYVEKLRARDVLSGCAAFLKGLLLTQMRTSTCLDEYSADCEYYGGGVVCMVVTFIFLFSFPFRLEPARVA